MARESGKKSQCSPSEISHLRFVTDERVILHISSQKLDGKPPKIKYKWMWVYHGKQPIKSLDFGYAAPLKQHVDDQVHEKFERFIKDLKKDPLPKKKDFEEEVQTISDRIRRFCVPPRILRHLRKLSDNLPTQILIITDDNSIPWDLGIENMRDMKKKNLSVGTLFNPEEEIDKPEIDFQNPKILLILPPISQQETEKTVTPAHKDRDKINMKNIKDIFSDIFRIKKDDSIVIVDALGRVLDHLAEGDFDFIYFLGHGVEKPDDGHFALKIKDGKYLTKVDIEEITRMRREEGNLKRKTPIVFLNACESIRGGYAAIAEAFLNYGACAVIGTYWRILDVPAIQFSKVFFKELCERQFATVSDALRIAKQQMKDNTNIYSSEYTTYSLRGVPGALLPIGSIDEGVICFYRFLKYQLYKLFEEDPAIMPRGISRKIIERQSVIMPGTTGENLENLLNYLKEDIPTIICVPVVTVAKLTNLIAEKEKPVDLAIVGVLFEPKPKTVKFLARKDEIGDTLRDILVHRTSSDRAFRIGVSGLHMVPTLLARHITMKQLGEDYTNGRYGGTRWVDLSQESLPKALEQKVVDVIVMYWPYLFELNESEYKVLEDDPMDLYETRERGRVIGQLVVTNRKHLEDHKEMIEKMLGLLQYARNLSIDNAPELAEIYHEEVGIAEAAAISSLRAIKKRDIAVRSQEKRKAIAQAISDFWKQAQKLGGLEKIPEVEIEGLIVKLPYPTEDKEDVEEQGKRLEDLLEEDNELSNLYKTVSNMDKSEVITLLRQIETTHPTFTSHGPDHSKNLIRKLEKLIPESEWKKFSCLEIFLLLYSAWIHDVGMVDYDNRLPNCTNEEEREKIRKKIRENHSERSYKWITETENHRRLGLNAQLARLIGKICKFHPKKYDITQLEKKWSEEGYEKYGEIRIQLLAVLIRLADACDISYERVKEVLVQMYNMTEKYIESKKHIEGKLAISNVLPEGRSIVVHVISDPKDKEEEGAVQFLKRNLEVDFLSVEDILKDAENGIGIAYDEVIIKRLEKQGSSQF